MAHPETVNVVLASDDKFAMPLAVCLRSLVDTAIDPDRLDIVVLSLGMRAETKAKVSQSVQPFSGSLSFVDLTGAEWDRLPEVRGHINSLATYARLLIPRVVPADWERAIYLDADLMIVEAIEGLWSHDLEGFAIGAIVDLGIPTVGSPGGVKSWAKLGLNENAPYMNAGVMLLDLLAMRRNRVCERALEYLENADGIEWYDQEALNAVTNGEFVELDQSWNVMHYWFKSSYVEMSSREAAEITARMKIRHFAGRRKPWLMRDLEEPPPGWEEYFRVMGRTEWKGEVAELSGGTAT